MSDDKAKVSIGKVIFLRELTETECKDAKALLEYSFESALLKLIKSKTLSVSDKDEEKVTEVVLSTKHFSEGDLHHVLLALTQCRCGYDSLEYDKTKEVIVIRGLEKDILLYHVVVFKGFCKDACKFLYEQTVYVTKR